MPIASDKAQRYQAAIQQIAALIADEPNLIANLANTSAELYQTFNFFWVGFYLVEDTTLVLGPFQGPSACTRITYGQGVCGTAWQQKQTQLVPDVHAFPGHIACSSLSCSEIVVPLIHQGHVWGVLDIDSDKYDSFDHLDQAALEQLAQLLTQTTYGTKASTQA